jgi:hypothetical protein
MAETEPLQGGNSPVATQNALMVMLSRVKEAGMGIFREVGAVEPCQ